PQKQGIAGTTVDHGRVAAHAGQEYPQAAFQVARLPKGQLLLHEYDMQHGQVQQHDRQDSNRKVANIVPSVSFMQPLVYTEYKEKVVAQGYPDDVSPQQCNGYYPEKPKGRYRQVMPKSPELGVGIDQVSDNDRSHKCLCCQCSHARLEVCLLTIHKIAKNNL